MGFFSSQVAFLYFSLCSFCFFEGSVGNCSLILGRLGLLEIPFSPLWLASVGVPRLQYRRGEAWPAGFSLAVAGGCAVGFLLGGVFFHSRFPFRWAGRRGSVPPRGAASFKSYGARRLWRPRKVLLSGCFAFIRRARGGTHARRVRGRRFPIPMGSCVAIEKFWCWWSLFFFLNSYWPVRGIPGFKQTLSGAPA